MKYDNIPKDLKENIDLLTTIDYITKPVFAEQLRDSILNSINTLLEENNESK